MHFTTYLTAAASFALTATAIPTSENMPRDSDVAVANIYAINGQTKKPLEIPFGKLTHFDLSITELQLYDVTIDIVGIPPPGVGAVTCQMYKDSDGIRPGSAEFTKDNPALISTNPVDFGWVLCYVNVDAPSK
ncbi:hypothetical protein FZEAL_5157 [Fusarium zealandicum]|uniref:Uncharacterized protein n=1 Tax=Fusarium zealandicum TaxID=1053134 RepID=A0A8H4UK96_9HYPO|nr:hypothetical protein FZEAL_5157 [Fusarium zealandicum]